MLNLIHYTARQRSVLAQAEEQRQWYEDHGGCLAAYINRYGSATDADHYGAGGEAIHQADFDALRQAETRADWIKRTSGWRSKATKK